MKFKLLTALAVGFLYQAWAANVYSGTRTVTTAGTRVRLSDTPISAISIAIQARVGNTGYIYVGGSDITSTTGLRLGPCTDAATTCVSVAFPVASGTNLYSLNNIWLDSSVSGEGVTYSYVQ